MNELRHTGIASIGSRRQGKSHQRAVVIEHEFRRGQLDALNDVLGYILNEPYRSADLGITWSTERFCKERIAAIVEEDEG